jgi:hypothetical protein
MFASGLRGKSGRGWKSVHNLVRSSQCKGRAEVHVIVRRVRESRRRSLDRVEMGRSDVQGGGGWWVVVVDVASDGDWKGGGKCWLVCGEVKARQGKARQRQGLVGCLMLPRGGRANQQTGGSGGVGCK